MYLKKLITTIVLIAMSMGIISAQNTNYDYRARFDSARELYVQGMYVMAESEFERLSTDIKDKSSLFFAEVLANKVMCAIALDRENIEGMVHDFENRFPNDPQLANVKFYLACHLFDKTEYDKALPIFSSIIEKNLYRTVKTEYHFKYAYCNMRVGNYDQSIDGFSKVIDASLGHYTYPAIYYTAYIHYLNKDFANAYTYFARARKDNRFTNIADYYAVESKFMLNDWDYAISQGTSIYDKLSNDLQGNLARIISESYFAKGENEKAKEYLDKYVNSGVTITRKDKYYAGVVSYSLKNYKEAIDAFADVLSNEDSIGQSAHYFTANSYLQIKNKISAQENFKAAANCNFDPVVTEDAMFNYAKLSFDVNNDISQFANYVEKYPNSGKDDVINKYMSVAFLENNDYASAIDVMGKIRNMPQEVSENYQKALLYRALQLIDSGGFKSAQSLLLKASENDSNSTITRLANYFLTECYYINGSYAEAINLGKYLSGDATFRKYDEYRMLLLNVAYSYFNLNKFEQAQPYFSSFLRTSAAQGSLERDASVRLADCYFMMGDYQKSADEYAKVHQKYSDNDIYANYQGALAYGLMNDYTNKIELLSKAVENHPRAELYPAALYELGRTYVQRNNADQASKCFETLLSSEDSSYYSRSLLELAMINSNSGQRQKAIDYYKRIISDTPEAEEVKDALAGMESQYQLLGNPQEYLAYLDGLGMSDSKTSDEKELMIFNAAEQVYLSGNSNNAIKSLLSFINSYPNGDKLAQAYFYLAESYKAIGRNESAADAYLQCMSKEKGLYSEAATRNYAEISYSLGKYTQALEAYETLIAIAQTTKNRNIGRLGKMMSNYSLRQYFKALNDAQKLAEDDSLEPEDIRQAQFISAKSNIVLGDRAAAKQFLTELCANTDDAIGAECAYILIQDLYDAGNFEQVEERVYALSESKTPQVYWLAKCFIVLGDSFADRDLWEQARATYESVRDGYKASVPNDDVPEQITMRLNKLKNMGK